uniref:Sulfatase N-terminal domain-containing protein n=1 Tax=Chaetoceros debilis TaxID=122233 RepID=A0A7S3Q4M0_9STRA
MFMKQLSCAIQSILLLHVLRVSAAADTDSVFDVPNGDDEQGIQSRSPSCKNNYEWAYSKNPALTCAGVQLIESRRIQLCGDHEEVQINCPLSCGRCCEDDPSYRIKLFSPNGFEFKSCEWLGTSIRSKLEWWCDTRNNGQFVRNACPKKCNTCSSYISSSPVSTPSFQPSLTPSTLPTDTLTPSMHPSRARSSVPSKIRSSGPTSTPTMTKSVEPSSQPTDKDSNIPTSNPSEVPTTAPSNQPSLKASSSPSSAPSSSPSALPSTAPSSKPSNSPTSSPSVSPSETPSSKPTKIPTLYPTLPPTPAPTQNPTPSPTEYKPNLIMILTDEHNFRTLSCYRDYLVSKVGRKSTDVWGDATRLDTPNIDTLASEGAMYTNFYTVAPLCTPSRASFMTGMYPAFTGDSALNHGAMDSNMKTFAEVLQEERGYRTGYFGKWHLDGEPSPGWGDNGRQFGFEENKYRFNRGHFKWIDEVEGNMAGYSIEDEWRFEGRESKHFTTDFLVDRGIEFIQRSVNKKEPFAMVLSIPDPHGPNDNRNYYRDMFNDRHFEIPQTAKKNMKFNPAAPGWNYFDLEEVPLDEVDNFVTEYENKERWQKVMRQYYGMVKCIDDNLGKLMRAIKDEGIDDDTIIVFTSDHGDLLMEHGKVNKGKPYETSAGIPFLVRFPGTIPAAKVIETAHSSVDFAPTILSLMGVPVNDTGVDFQGADGSEELLSDPSQTILTNMKYEEKIIFSIDSGKSPVWAMAQMGWYKFIVSKNGAPYLFDLLHDPDEMYNYADSYLYTDIKNKLRDSLTMALFEFDFPIAWYSDNIYFDIPACYDKRDILPLVGDTISRCSDVGTKIDFSRCKDQQNIRVHCGESCHACCKDTVGRMIVKEKVYNSCLELEADDACTWGKVKTFCPVTCNQCEEA